MVFKKGNKCAAGNSNSGRPRRFNLEEEAKALVEWAQTKDALVLRVFAALRDYPSQEKMHEYCAMSDVYREAYNKAKVLIGARREQLLINGKGHPAPFNRYAALYDSELKQHEKELKADEKNLSTGPLKVEVIDYQNAT